MAKSKFESVRNFEADDHLPQKLLHCGAAVRGHPSHLAAEKKTVSQCGAAAATSCESSVVIRAEGQDLTLHLEKNE
uniref:Uncharacterized protein n=1 Tax=Knipowitschia caucasica TaxID=637954 RepID=A0AAV2MLA8_KNICA